MQLFRALALPALVLLIGAGTATAQEVRALPLAGGGELTYLLLLPPNFDPDATYPVVVGMPPGAQSMEMARWGLRAYWGIDATERGWIVVSPIVARGGWGGSSGTQAMGALLDQIASEVTVEGGKFHLVGCSNGGNSAFRLAVAMPERFHSLTTVPGSVRGEDYDNLERLAALKVRLHVGAQDRGWLGAAERAHKRLRELGVDAEIQIWANEGHVIEGLMNGELMRRIEAYR